MRSFVSSFQFCLINFPMKTCLFWSVILAFHIVQCKFYLHNMASSSCFQQRYYLRAWNRLRLIWDIHLHYFVPLFFTAGESSLQMLSYVEYSDSMKTTDTNYLLSLDFLLVVFCPEGTVYAACVYTRLQKRWHLKSINRKRWDPTDLWVVFKQ